MMAATSPSISVIVPCYNEEKNVRGAIESIGKALLSAPGPRGGQGLSDYEILLFNDCSTDSTGAIADGLLSTEPRLKVIHNPRNMGFGYNYTEGVRLASRDYVIMVPGDNEIPSGAIEEVLSHISEADIIIPFTANPWTRPLSRRVVSRAFVLLMNSLFGLRLRYYNGTCLIRASMLKKVPMKTWGFAYMAAILVRLLRTGASFIEVGVVIRPRESGKSKAFRPRNVISVVGALAGLFWEVRVSGRSRYKSAPRRVAPALPQA